MKTTPCRISICALGVGLLLGASCVTSYAATTTWTSASSTDFTNASNWSSGAISGGSAVLANNDSVVHSLTYSGSSLSIASLSIDNTGLDYSIGGSGLFAISTAAGLVISGGGSTTISPTVWFSFGGTQTLNSGSASLSLGGIQISSSLNILNLSNTTPVIVSGTVQTYVGSTSARSLQLTGAGSMTVNGVIVNNTATATTGVVLEPLFTGTLTLNGTNTYTGATVINNGTLVVNGSLAGTAVSGSASSVLAGSGTINGTVTTSGTISGGLTFNNDVTLNSAAKVTAGVFNGNIVANGAITSAVNVRNGKTLSGTGTISGSVVDSGTISGGLTFSNDVTVDSGGAVTGGMFNGNVTDNGTITSALTVASGKTLAGSGTAASVMVSGGTINGSGLTLGATTLYGSSTLSGYNIASSVTVAGGSTTLSGTTQTSGTLSVASGATLSANGTIDGSSSVSGWFKGSSTVTGNLSLTGGTLSLGNSPGITTVAGNFTMDKDSTLVAEVRGTVAGISYDQVKVSGNVILAGTLDIRTLSGLTLGDTITLIENTDSGTTTGYFSSIITSGSTYTVTTSGSTYTFTVDSMMYEINYSANTDGGGTFNDVTLTVVPEPSTWAILLGGVGMLALSRRMYRR